MNNNANIGYKNIQHEVCYPEIVSDQLKEFWNDYLENEVNISLLKYLSISIIISLVFLPSTIFAKSNSNNIKYRASIQKIPLRIQQKMKQYTWRPGCPVDLNQLSYIKLSYWGFDHKTHHGILIVNRLLAKQVVQIFEKLYQHRFPIQRVQPMYKFKGNITAALEANSTLAFTCRAKTGHRKGFSLHSYGRAIDINTRVNPYVKGKIVLPPSGRIYLNRKQKQQGMIIRGDIVYKTFTNHGWRWGGNWKTLKDYMHFEKP